MSKAGYVLAGLATVGIIAASRRTSPLNPANEGGTMTRKQKVWRKLGFLPLTNVQRYFAMLVAYGEGGYDPRAHNTRPSERAAARRAVENNATAVARVVACGVPRSVMEDGSWGIAQRLGPYLSIDAFEIFGAGAQACALADPRSFDLDFQICSLIETAHDLGGYNGFKAYPTVGNLRLGFAAPALMGYIDDNAKKLATYRSQAAHEKFPAGIVDATITRFPKATPQFYATLRQNPVA